MKFASTLAAMATALAAPVAAADMPQVGPGRYRCSLPSAGSERSIMPLQPGRELRIAFRMTRSDPVRRELAFIRFDGPDGPSRIAVGRAGADLPRLYASARPPRWTEDPIFYYPIRATPKWILLRLTVDEQGVLTIRSNQLRRQFRWGPVTRASVGCRSGEWDIDVWPRSYLAGPQIADGASR